MIQRCHNPNNPSFHNYGARGIYVCERWRESVANYYADMGDPPEGATLERIDNDGAYSPDNCRWATRAEQNSNTRKNIYVECDGELVTVAEASRRTGVNRRTIEQRYHKGIRGPQLLSAPKH